MQFLNQNLWLNTNILTELRTVGTTVETVDIPRISSIAVKSHQIPATILYDFEIFVDKIW